MTLTQISSRGVEDTLRWSLGASGTDHYTFTGPGLTGTVNDPTIYLSRGQTYVFENNSGGHPFQIQSVAGSGGSAYSTGVTNNGGGNGTEIKITVPHDAPDNLYYQCTSHPNMGGTIFITGAVAAGSITTAKLAADAVDGTKLADNAVAAEHIAANAVGSSEIADTAVTLAKLEHGTGSNDGKFLRANNGADPSFETVSIPAGTTINNNADNRVITGSGTANTLNGESDLTFDGSKLQVNHSSLSQIVQSYSANNRFKTLAGSNFLQMITQNDVSLQFRYATDTGSGTEVARVNSHGISFSGNNAAAESLDDYEEGSWTPAYYAWSGGGTPTTTDHAHGRYVKIGRCVYVMFDIKGDRGNMGGSYITIAGLPFTTYGTGLGSRGGWASIPWTEYVGSENSTSSTRGHGLDFGGGATVHAWLTGYTNTSSYLPTYISTSYMSNSNHTRLFGNGFYFTEQ